MDDLIAELRKWILKSDPKPDYNDAWNDEAYGWRTGTEDTLAELSIFLDNWEREHK